MEMFPDVSRAIPPRQASPGHSAFALTGPAGFLRQHWPPAFLCNSHPSVLESVRAAGHGDRPQMHLRCFISLPEDVAREGRQAQEVVKQEILKNPLLHGQVNCEAVRRGGLAAARGD